MLLDGALHAGEEVGLGDWELLEAAIDSCTVGLWEGALGVPERVEHVASDLAIGNGWRVSAGDKSLSAGLDPAGHKLEDSLQVGAHVINLFIGTTGTAHELSADVWSQLLVEALLNELHDGVDLPGDLWVVAVHAISGSNHAQNDV